MEKTIQNSMENNNDTRIAINKMIENAKEI